MQVTNSSTLPTTGVSSSANASSTSSSSSTANANSTSASATAAATVDYNSFLQLLVAELSNQDPTNPTDPTQYMSQLASFSAVGQSVQTNQKLDTMLTTSALQQADSAIGRTVTSADNTISGIVSSVSIGTDGTVTASLSNGQSLPLGSGVTVS